jgi:uncharacterized small protein (DUF1192 family)
MATPNIHAADRGAQEQVILPVSIAFGICVRGIKTRLGRSMVTLFGVGLGIAFLMSVVAGFHVKQVMSEEAAITREVDQRIAVLRSEVGRLQGKRFALIGKATGIDAAFVEALQKDGAIVQELKTDGVVAGLLLGDYGASLTSSVTSSLAGIRLYDFQSSSLPTIHASLPVRHLGIELRPDEIARAKELEQQAQYRTYWIVGVSLLITVIGIANAMLMSVTERIREIGTMKCLGALSSFVVKLFLIESSLTGFAGAVLGSVGGALFSLLAYSYSFGLTNVWTSVSYPALLAYGAACVAVGVVLAVIAGIYPARVAAKMIPAAALSSNV